ncbi:MAG: DsbA family protein [Pseudomonadaceae bacterium]|nr:DsbA family protein [Pseudomonadaceae bacterium]
MNLETRLRSLGIRRFTSARHLENLRRKARKRRKKSGAEPVVHYFHQVDDPYSHLAVQKLATLRDHYTLSFKPHLVSKPGDDYLGSAEHFDAWAITDCKNVAAHYGVTFNGIDAGVPPSEDRIALANSALASAIGQPDFDQRAIAVGEALWRGETIETENSTSALPALAEGDRLRESLGHYQGGMFYLEGEWFWGIDRIRSLEARLIEEGFASDSSAGIQVPQPAPATMPDSTATSVLLEYFPSLRSPYTAIGHQRVLDMIERTGVQVDVRPVMPMLMRGVKAPRAKQMYIATDSGREARTFGVPFGKIVDPFGDPVRRAFALFPGAIAQGRPMEFVTSYLAAAWHKGVDITNDQGLEAVADDAGLDWSALKSYSHSSQYEALLADNLDAMLGENLWGVPSFRVSGGNQPDKTFACWGQDRIWRVEDEINSRASTPS